MVADCAGVGLPADLLEALKLHVEHAAAQTANIRLCTQLIGAVYSSNREAAIGQFGESIVTSCQVGLRVGALGWMLSVHAVLWMVCMLLVVTVIWMLSVHAVLSPWASTEFGTNMWFVCS